MKASGPLPFGFPKSTPRGEKYGEGYQFLSATHLEPNETPFKPKVAAVSPSYHVRRFFDLSRRDQAEFAAAVAEKEANILLHPGKPEETILFEKDRHEGNFLEITDKDVLQTYGIGPGIGDGAHLILAIDPGQASEIKVHRRDAVAGALAVIAAWQHDMLDEIQTAAELHSARSN